MNDRAFLSHGARLLLSTIMLGVGGLRLSEADEPSTFQAGSQSATAGPWSDQKSEWQGFDRYHFEVAGRGAYVVVPREPAAGNPWIWRATFPDYHPEIDAALLGHGFHVAYLDTSDRYGSEQALNEAEQFFALMVERGLSPQAVLEGVSRGGLLVYRFAVRHPDRVAAIYCDTPVLDIKSWPGGKGTGVGSPGDWDALLKSYNMTEDEALGFRGNPVDEAQRLAKSGIPLIHIVTEDDRVVPPAENTYLLKSRLEETGGTMEVISVAEGKVESQGHHFDHPAVNQVVEFLLRHAHSASQTEPHDEDSPRQE